MLDADASPLSERAPGREVHQTPVVAAKNGTCHWPPLR